MGCQCGKPAKRTSETREDGVTMVRPGEVFVQLKKDVSSQNVGSTKSIGLFEDDFDLSDSRELGAGSFGSVKTAVRRSTGDEFAVKALSLDVSPSDLQDIRNEISAMMGLSHPNIARLVGVYENVTKACLLYTSPSPRDRG